jgi:CelD/BcsL family acetyltransferase involved in cellulose biosynthesis
MSRIGAKEWLLIRFLQKCASDLAVTLPYEFNALVLLSTARPWTSGFMNFALRMPVRSEAPALTLAVEPGFDFAGPEYRALQQRSASSAFQAPGWLDALQRDVGAAFGAEPVTVTIRNANGGRLMLVLPLARACRRGVTYLEFADFGLCDYLGPVYDQSEAPLLLADASLPDRLAAALPRHDLIALTKLAGEDPLLAHLFPAARRGCMRISAYPTPLRGDWMTWRNAALDPSQRRELDMKRRRLDRSGQPAFKLLRDADEITRAFETLRRYRTERFKALGAPDVLDHEVVFTFYRRIAIEGARDGAARTECLCLDGELLAVMFGLAQRGVYSMLMVGLDIARHRRLSPGLLAIEDSMRAAIEAGDRVYDFTIGDHPYKLRFGGKAIPLHEWYQARTVRGYAAMLAITLVREAKRKLVPLLKRRASTPAAKQKAAQG